MKYLEQRSELLQSPATQAFLDPELTEDLIKKELDNISKQKPDLLKNYRFYNDIRDKFDESQWQKIVNFGNLMGSNIKDYEQVIFCLKNNKLELSFLKHSKSYNQFMQLVMSWSKDYYNNSAAILNSFDGVAKNQYLNEWVLLQNDIIILKKGAEQFLEIQNSIQNWQRLIKANEMILKKNQKIEDAKK